LRIARELHDSVGHHLISLSLQLEAAEHLPDSQLRGQLAHVRFISRLLLADVREAVSEWRGETSSALPEALRVLAGALAGAKVTLGVEDSTPAVSPAVTHALFRCTQEAITNAVKHGGAGEIAVRLREREGALELEIEDNGRGAAVLQPGNGLTGMQSRVAEIGGKVEFRTAQNAGFRIAIHVPLAAEEGA
jgi:signal transduction histidine kinase